MYTESLSEQLALAGAPHLITATTFTTATTVSNTSGVIDMRERHRCLALAYAMVARATDTGKAGFSATAKATITLSVLVEASAKTAFATPTTVASATVTATAVKKVAKGTATVTATTTTSANFEADVTGEMVQGARVAIEDRYIRVTITETGKGTGLGPLMQGFGLVLADTARYKPI